MDYNTKCLYVILIKNKPTAPLQSTLTRTWDGGAVVIVDLLALEQRLLKAVSPNTFLLDTLGWWWWKVPVKGPSSHQGKRGQCLSTGTSLCRDLPRAHLDWPREHVRVPGIHPDPLAVKQPGAPKDTEIRTVHTGCWPSGLPWSLVLSPMTSSPWVLSLSAFFPCLLGCPLPSWLCFLLQLLWIFLWLSLTAHSQPTTWSFCPWQLRTKLPLDQTPIPSAHMAPKARFLQCFSHGWAGKSCGGLYSSSSRVGNGG